MTPLTDRQRPPHDCPVCGDRLAVVGLQCESCGTGLSGRFETCEFCALDDGERALLHVFLAARGNMKELERHLRVSYPTARARFDAVLARLGLQGARAATEPSPRAEVLDALARGELDVDDALRRLDGDPADAGPRPTP